MNHFVFMTRSTQLKELFMTFGYKTSLLVESHFPLYFELTCMKMWRVYSKITPKLSLYVSLLISKKTRILLTCYSDVISC